LKIGRYTLVWHCRQNILILLNSIVLKSPGPSRLCSTHHCQNVHTIAIITDRNYIKRMIVKHCENNFPWLIWHAIDKPENIYTENMFLFFSKVIFLDRFLLLRSTDRLQQVEGRVENNFPWLIWHAIDKPEIFRCYWSLQQNK
jgi:hypothetical protein